MKIKALLWTFLFLCMASGFAYAQNNAPIIDPISPQVVDEGQHLEFVVTSSDIDGDTLTLIAELLPTNAAFADSGNGHGLFTFDPDYTQAGPHQVRFIVSDGSLSDTGLVDITVNDVNQPPVLDPIGAQVVDEGGHLEFVVTSSDIDGDTLTLVAELLPTNAAFTDSGNGHGLFTFDPDYTQAGPHQVRFIVSDGSLSDTGLVDITVNDVNRAPVLDPTSPQVVDEGAHLEFVVTSSDIDGDTLTLVAELLPTNAAFTDSGNGHGLFTFDPDYTQAGPHQVRFIVSDGSLSDTGLVDITVNDVNQPPVLDPIGAQVVDEGAHLEFVVTSSDIDGDTLTLVAELLPTNSAFTDSGNGNGLFTFDPDYTQDGPHQVRFIVSDGSLSDTGLVDITVNDVNQPPVLDPIGAQVVDEGGHLEFVVTSSDIDGDSLILTAELLPTNAAFTDSGNGHGLFTFDPDYTQAGPHQVRFIVSDGSLSDTGLVDITVNDVNQPPVLDPIGPQVVDEGGHLEFVVTSSDIDGDSLILTAELLPTNAAFTDSGNGHGLFTFDPDYTQDGPHQVRFIVSAGVLADTELVDITVNDVNQPPVLDPIGAQVVDEGAHLEFVVTSSDIDGDTLTLVAELLPTNAAFTDSGNGHGLFTFDPDYTQAGPHQVRFIVSDGSLSDTGLVDITVNDVNRAPVLDPTSPQAVDEGGHLEFVVTSSDIDGDSLILTAELLPANAAFTDSGNGHGLFTFDPDYTQAGPHQVRFIVSDGSLSDTGLVDITVNDVNQPPVLDPIGAQVVDEGAHLEFVVTSSDIDGDTLTLIAELLPTNAAFTDSGNGHGLFTFDPDYTQNGTYDVRFIVSDGILADSQLVSITVNRVNIAPVLAPISPQVIDEGQHLEFIVSATDVNDDGISLIAQNMVANSSFTDSGNGNGLFTFDPDYSQSDVYNIRFIASDGELTDTQLVEITVNHVNLAPVLDSIPPQVINENTHFVYLVTSSDFDNDSLIISISNSPFNSSFTDNGDGTGQFVFDPSYTQAGPYNVRFIVSDGALADTAFMGITVIDVNAPPVIDPIGPQVVDEGQSLGLLLTSSDIDGDSIILSAEELPANAAFTDSGNGHGWFLFTPDYTQSGDYTVRFIASDGANADTELVSITVNDVNLPPILDPISPQVVDEGAHLEYVVTASDFDGDVLALAMFDFPANAVFVDSGNGHGLFTFDPDYTQEGAYSVMFTVSDGALADTTYMDITVNHYNTYPVLNPIGAQTVAEGAILEIYITSTDNEGDLLVYTVEDIPTNASFVDSGNGNGLFSFSPGYFQAGSYFVRFIVSDGEFADSELVQIDVTNTNRPPVLAHIGSRVVDEGQHLEFVVSATEPDSESVVLTAQNLPVNAAFYDSGNGRGLFEFDPDFTQAGTYTIRFIASDGSLSDTGFTDIIVNDVNHIPVLDSIGNQIINEGDHLELHITSSDSDIDDISVLTAEDLPAANASFVDSGNGNGLFTFDPDYTQSGSYNVLFIVNDGEAADSELVNITVNEVNLTPVLADIPSPQTLDENQSLQFNISATDPDGVIPSLAAYDMPPNAAFTDSGNGTGTFTFSPDYFQAGNYYVIFEASDGDLADSQTVEIIVNNINRAPTLSPIPAQTVDEGQHLEFLVNASDPDLETLVLTAQNLMANATFTDSGNGVGLFAFDPGYTQAGNYIVRFMVSDGSLRDTIYVDITVNPVNAAPILAPIPTPQVVGEENSLAIPVSAIDPDGTTPSLAAFNLPTNASFSDSGDGTGGFYFNPVYGQAGGYDVLFIASDAEYSDSQYVHIDVVITNSPPVLDSIPSQTVAEGETLQLIITATDPDSTFPFITALDLPTNAALYDSGNGHALFEFMPDFSQEGGYSVTIIASDGSFSDTGLVSITVTHTNVAPAWDTIPAQFVDEGDTLELVVTASDFDLDSLILTAANLPGNAAFIDSANGHGYLVYSPDYTESGVYQIQLIVNDGVLADTESVDVTVNHVNIQPVLASIGPQSVDEGGHLEFTVFSSDFDNDSLILSAENVPVNASFIDSGNGSGLFVFDPDYTQGGLHQVLIIASDGALADSELVDVAVNNINLPPALNPIAGQTVNEGDHLEFVVISSDADPDILILTAENLPANSAFVDSGNGHGLFTFDPDFSQADSFQVRFIVSDGALADTELADIRVNDVNVAPEINSIADQFISEGDSLELIVISSDFDLDLITLTAANLPSANAAFVDSGNGHGLFIFTPDYTQSGVYNVSFIASDGVLADTEIVNITVSHINIRPVLDPIGPQVVNEGDHLEFVVTSSDFDNDLLTLTAQNLPVNAAFVDSGNGHGLFTFDPSYTQANGYQVRFIVRDGALADTELVSITVLETNRPPVITPIADRELDENTSLNFVVFATDPDGVIPSLTAFDLPLNATFVDLGTGSGLFDFDPDYTQSGIYNVGFVASDGDLADTEMVQITVNHVNLAPVLDPIAPQVTAEGGHLEFVVVSSDFDNDVLVLTAQNFPANSSFADSGNGHGLFTFNPNYIQAGNYNVRFITSDGALSDTINVDITVNNTNRPPVLGTLTDRSVDEDNFISFIVSATDPDGFIPLLSAFDLPANATFEDYTNGTGLFTFSPDFSQAGIYSIGFTASDGDLADTDYVQVTVNQVNLAPVLNPILPQSVPEGGHLEFVVTSSDFDNDLLTLSAEDIPLNAAFVDSGNGHGLFAFDPSFDQAGVYYVRFIVFDGSLADSQLVSISVGSTNLPPVGGPIADRSVNEKSFLSFTVTFTDPDGQLLSLSSFNRPPNSSFVDNDNNTGRFEFSPDSSQAGLYTVGFVGFDGALSDTVYASITVNDVNVAPILDSIPSPQQVTEGQTLAFNVSASDYDGNALTLTTSTLPANATFVDSGNGIGSFNFNPDFDQSGDYDIWFYAADTSLADSQQVHITVNEINRAPLFTVVPSQSVDEGGYLEFVVEAIDPDGQIPVLTGENLPTNSAFVDSGNGHGLFTFSPDFTQAGNHSLRFIASDSSLTDTLLVSVTVNNVNQTPEIDPIGPQLVNEGEHLEFIVTSSDFDPDILILTAENLPVNAAFTDSGNGHGLFTFDPDYNQSGLYTIRFIVSDGQLSDTALADITVLHVNVAPVLDPIGDRVISENSHLEFVITASDIDLQTLTLIAQDLPVNSTFADSGNGHGLFIFDPDYNQSGIYPVRFIVSDGTLADSELVQITVNNINLAPEITPIADTTVGEGSHLEILVSATDFDNNPISLSAINVPVNASFVDSGNGYGLFTFDPSYTQDGLYNVSFIASDGVLADTEAVSITVFDTNLPPQIVPIADRVVNEGAFLSFIVSASDPDGVIPSFTIFDAPANTTFEDYANGTALFTFSPNYTQAGVYNVGFIASDGALADTEMVQITVNQINIAPVFDPIPAQIVSEGGHLEFVVISTDYDNDALTLTAFNVPANASFADSGNGHGLFIFNPNYGQSGNYNVRFISSDGALSDTIDVTITVNNVNQAPVLGTLTDRVINENQYLSFIVSATDPDGTIPLLNASSIPANATFEDNGNGSGLFTFLPDYSQSGVYNVRFIATDGDLTDTGFVQITVNQVNLAPVLNPILPQSVDEGGHLELVVESSDYDNDQLFLSAENIPVNSSFADSGNGHGLFIFDPSFDQAGVYYVRFIVFDGSLADSQLVSISVGGTNLPPVGDPIADQFVDEQDTLAFTVTFTDPDGQLLSLSAFDLPVNSSFTDNNNGTGDFTFMPDSSQAGIYSVGFVGFDGVLADTVYTNVTVNDINVAPVLDSIPTPQTVAEGQSLQFNVTASDFDGNVLILSTSLLPANAAFVDSGNNVGTFTFNPDYTQSGDYDIWFYAADTALADSQQIHITVNEINRAPQFAVVPSQSVDEGGYLEFVVEAVDPDGQIPVLTAEGLPVNSSFADSGNGHGLFSFAPDFTQSGLYSVSFLAGDGELSDTLVVDITVNDVNQAPVLDPIGAQAMNEGEHLEFVVTSSDFDLDLLVLTAEDLPVNAAFTDSGNGHGLFTFDPDYTQSGIYNIRFIVSDGALSDSELVTITVTHVNVPPVLDPIGAQTVNEDEHLEFVVTASDIDEFQTLTLTADNLPVNAAFTDSGNGHGLFVFDPDYTQSGIYSVIFIASDSVLADSELVLITVNNINIAPAITQIPDTSISEGQHLQFRVLAIDFDGDPLTLSALNVPVNAAFTDSGNGHGLFTFDPNYTQDGVYNVSFIASDGNLADTEAVAITVNDSNLPPSITPIADRVVNEGAYLSFIVSASDPDGVIPVLTVFGNPANTTFEDYSNGTGLFTFSPDYTQSGIYDVGFVASDGALADTEMVQITVNHVNIAPTLSPISSQVVDEGQHLEFVVTSTDFDNDPLILTSQNMPANASFADSGNGHGLFAFDPDFGQSGNYNVKFICSDGALSDTLDVTITVNNVNLPPVLGTLTDRVINENEYLSFVVTATDPDGTVPLLSAFSLPANAGFVDNGNGTGLFTFQPDYSQSGVHTVGFIATDGTLTDTGFVQITVNQVNLPPILDPILPQAVEEGGHLEFIVTSSDFDNDTLTLTAEDVPVNAVFTDSSNGHGLFVFNPTFDQEGIYYVRFIVSDGSLADSQLVSISVGGTNLPPVGDPIDMQFVYEKDTLRFTVTFTDPDGQLLSLTVFNNPANSFFQDHGNSTGTFEFRPDSSQAGFYNVRFVGFDGMLADTVTAQILVEDVNVAPILDSIPTPQTVAEGQSLEFNVTASDFDGNLLTLSTSLLPANAAFVDSGNNVGTFTFNPDYTQSGDYDIWFIASDTSLADSQLVRITVVEQNLAPVMVDIPAQSVDEGGLLEFVVSASDPDGQALTLFAEDMPANAAFRDSGNGNGLFSFAPDYSQSGVYDVVFIASDGDLADSVIVNITVNHINLAPAIDSIGPQVTSEGQHFELVVTSADFDNDALTLTALGLPANSTFADSGNGHGLFSFDPEYGQAGVYTVSFIVSDGALADTEIVNITVLESNRPPVWNPIPNYSVQEGGVLAFNVAATDPDTTIPLLSVVNLPANATFVDSGNGHGRFRFAPDYTQSGIYDLLFLASDGELSDTAVVRITVNESGNQHPVIAPIAPQVVNEGEHLEFIVIATDPEGSVPILSAFGLPGNSAFYDSGNGHGLFTFDPDFFQADIYNVSFIAFDGQLADTQAVAITVLDVGFPPIIDPIGPQTVVEGSTLEIIVTASDPDLTDPSLIAENLPLNAAFTDSGNGHGLFTFSPDYTQAGVDTVLFIASDGALADSEYVQITITDFGNVAPVIDTLANQAVFEGDTLSLIVTATDPDGTIPQLSATGLPANAFFVDNFDGTGQFDFYPDYYQAGLYNVTFVATDSALLADSITVEISVSDANGPPILATIPPQTVIEGDSLGIAISAIDPDNDIILFSALDIPENGYLVDNGDGTGVLNFLPSFAQAGSYLVTVIASDGAQSDSQAVSITVTEAGNQAPQFYPVDTLLAVVEGDSLGLIVAAYDLDNDSISFNFTSLPFNSGYQMLTPDTAVFYFTPDYTQVGNYTVIATVSDSLLSSSINLHIEVLDAGNLPPVFDPVPPQVIDEGDTLTLDLVANDPDGAEPPLITINNQHPHSQFTDNGDGTATYIYLPDYYDAGLDTAVFIAVDSDNLQGILRVEITTNEYNIPPSLFYEGDSVALQGETLTAQLIATDSTDGDGGPIFLSSLYLPVNAGFVDNGDLTGTFTFTPDYDQLGMDSAVFLAVDDGVPSRSTRLTVHLEIRDQNRPPIWDPIDSYEIDQAETLSVALSASDPDGDTIVIRLATTPTPPRNCSVTDNGDGTGVLVFAPDYTQSGAFVIRVEAYDMLDRAIAYVFVFVNDLGNQTPTLNFINDMTMVEGDTLQVHITATDPDSTPPAIAVENEPYRFQFTDNGDGSGDVYFEPLFNQSGLYTLLFMAIDPAGASDSQYVNLEVIEAGNQLPRLGAITDRSVDEGAQLTFTVLADDPDSTIPYLDVVNLPANANFIDNHDGSGLFLWIPSFFQAGEYVLTFRAIDFEDSSLVVTRDVTITVNNVNRSPEFEQVGPFIVYEGDSLGFLVTAIDPDSTFPILVQSTPLNNSTFIDSGNGIGYFSLEPDYGQAGNRVVGFTAYDVEDSSYYGTMAVNIAILNTDRPPVMAQLPSDTLIQDGVQFVLTVNAIDPDGEIPELLAHNLPENATFTDNNNGSGVFNFTPGFGDLGEYFVTFVAEDANNPSLADSQTVRIEVISTGMHPPQFQPTTTQWDVTPDSLISVRMEAIDVDGGLIVIDLLGSLPDGATFVDSGSGIASFVWLPQEADSGFHVASFTATDETSLSDTLTLNIQVITWIRGDANGDGLLIGSDVTYLVNFFRGVVPRPYPEGRGDANGDGLILGSDVTFLVNYFRGTGPPPPPASPGGGRGRYNLIEMER